MQHICVAISNIKIHEPQIFYPSRKKCSGCFGEAIRMEL
jgi:hypothetical protein